MKDNLEIFREEYLGADTWAQRKDGVPLELLDNLSAEEIKIAELELIKVANLGDSWPIIGLGHIKSKNSLPVLYRLLNQSKGGMRVTIAHSIFQISEDKKMIEIVLECMPKITNQYELIDVLYFLRNFQDQRITEMHHGYRNHKEYLVAYNAAQSLGLPTEKVVKKFRYKKSKDF